jgi:hypothetical protein
MGALCIRRHARVHALQPLDRNRRLAPLQLLVHD